MAPNPELHDISKALGPLRRVVASLKEASEGRLPSGAARASTVRAVRAAGHAALPTLLRALCSGNGHESSWAYFLLGRLGGERVIRKLGELLEDREVADAAKARAMGLLSDLDAPIPHAATLKDPEALLEKSVKELLASLDSDEERGAAAQLIVEQVPEAELPAFCAELVRHGHKRAVPVLDLLLAHAFSDETRAELARLKREAGVSPSERAVHAALERGLEYLEAGKPRAARRRLERFVASEPRCAEGRSALGICLLQLDRCDDAVAQLERAAELEPDEPLHRWNLAAAAKQAERMGGAYLALREYLTLHDESGGAEGRVKEARRFVRAYERMLRESHPGVALTDYLRGEELFARAHAALSEGRPDEAVHGFEAVIALVPRHYPSWGNLGAAFLQLERRDDAQRCLEQALALNPDYAIARKNLELLASTPA